LFVLLGLLVWGGAFAFSYIHYHEIFGPGSDSGELSWFSLLLLSIAICECVFIFKFFAEGFISRERACIYALQVVLKDEIKSAYHAPEARTCGHHVEAPGEVELFTAGDWEIFKKKSQAKSNAEEEDKKRRAERRSEGFFEALGGVVLDEWRDLSEIGIPFAEWLRSARRRAREKRRLID